MSLFYRVAAPAPRRGRRCRLIQDGRSGMRKTSRVQFEGCRLNDLSGSSTPTSQVGAKHSSASPNLARG